MIYLYNRLVDTNSIKGLYWDRESSEPLSLAKFFEMYKSAGGKFIIWIQLKDELVGVASISTANLHKCYLSAWAEPRWRGPNMVYIGRQVIQYIHETIQIKQIYAMTPWNAAAQLFSKIGVPSIAMIPKLCVINGRERDVEIFHSDGSKWTQHVTMSQQDMPIDL